MYRLKAKREMVLVLNISSTHTYDINCCYMALFIQNHLSFLNRICMVFLRKTFIEIVEKSKDDK